MRAEKKQKLPELTLGFAGAVTGYARLNGQGSDSEMLGMITARPVLSPDGDVVDFEYLTANSAMQRTHGISPDDLVGKTMLSVFPELADHVTFPYYCEVAKNRPADFF